MSLHIRYQDNTFNLESDILNKGAYFWYPDYLDTSAWTEHIPFAFWLIESFHPKSIVELGVFKGTSYFAFCQAVTTLNISCTCYGVDSWKGDEHTGFYNDEVYKKVSTYNERYTKFSTLIRSTFDEANDYFLDGSIDLLHIDGFHTYEEVKADFEKWYPKLSDNAIVLFHDINIRERGFGVFRLWDEIKKDRLHTQFDFGCGLGVLATGKNYSPELMTLFNEGQFSPVYLFLRNFFADRGKLFSQANQIAELTAETRNLIASVQAAHNDQEQLKQLNLQLKDEVSQLVTVRQEVDALKQEVIAKTIAIEESRNQVLEQEPLINNLNTQNQQLRDVISEERKNRDADNNYLTLKLASPFKKLITKKPRTTVLLIRFFFKLYWFITGKMPSKKQKLLLWKKHPEIPYSQIDEYLLIQQSGLFNEEWYLAHYKDSIGSHANPLLYYMTTGYYQGHDPGPDFSTEKYYDEHEDVKRKRVNPLVHYLHMKNIKPDVA